ERAVSLDPRQTLVRAEFAKAYERANNLGAMADQYRALRELAPQDPEYAYHMRRAYLRLAQWCLEQMMRLDPESPRGYESLADAYRAQGRTDEAIRAFQRAAQADPKLPGIHLALADLPRTKKTRGCPTGDRTGACHRAGKLGREGHPAKNRFRGTETLSRRKPPQER